MPDREKVIKVIEDCVFHNHDCVGCDYDGCVFKHGDCRRDLLADALELLKSQRETIDELISADKLLKEQEEQIRQLTEELEELRNKRNEVYYSGYDGSFIMEV